MCIDWADVIEDLGDTIDGRLMANEDDEWRIFSLDFGNNTLFDGFLKRSTTMEEVSTDVGRNVVKVGVSSTGLLGAEFPPNVTLVICDS